MKTMPNKPQNIAVETWQAVEKAVCAGMGYSEAARRFGVRSPHAIIMRARRNRWPVPSRIVERAHALQRSVTARAAVTEGIRQGNEEVAESLAASWAEKGEQHRALAFGLSHTALAKSKPPALQTWRDMEIADKMARRAAGLDSEGATGNTNIFQFQLLRECVGFAGEISVDCPKIEELPE